MDIDSVPLGIDFVDHVTQQISLCSAVIVMIGKQWLTIKDKKRRRRLDNEPHPDDLPNDIRPLARRNGIQLRPDQWREGVERLLRELDG